MTIRIFTLTGASGSGKITIEKNLFEWLPEKLTHITSTTTRSPRESDFPSDYEYVTINKFLAVKKRNEFLWTTPPFDGQLYGTRKRAVDKLLKILGKFGLMVLIPQCVTLLRNYIPGQVYSFYIVSPPWEELRRRMQKRGDAEKSIQKRLAECNDWGINAMRTNDFDKYIVNEDGDEKALKASNQIWEKILAIINKQKSAS